MYEVTIFVIDLYLNVTNAAQNVTNAAQNVTNATLVSWLMDSSLGPVPDSGFVINWWLIVWWKHTHRLIRIVPPPPPPNTCTYMSHSITARVCDVIRSQTREDILSGGNQLVAGPSDHTVFSLIQVYCREHMWLNIFYKVKCFSVMKVIDEIYHNWSRDQESNLNYFLLHILDIGSNLKEEITSFKIWNISRKERKHKVNNS